MYTRQLSVAISYPIHRQVDITYQRKRRIVYGLMHLMRYGDPDDTRNTNKHTRCDRAPTVH